MVAAGFADVPIISLSAGQADLHEQPGVQFNFARYVYGTMMSALYADALSTLYHATVTRECNRGAALALADRYLTLLDTGELALQKKSVLHTLKQAVVEFNAIKTKAITYPKVGILGEIYVKHNSFANHQVAQWFINREIEVVGPGLVEFFLSWLVHVNAAVQANVRRPHLLSLISSPLIKYASSLLGEVENVLRRFKHYTPGHRIEDVTNKAQEVLALTHQYGEGWLIAGEIGALVKDGVQNIICLQPFGCIANHVVAKGVEKRLKELYPQINLLFLDADAGVSEVNYQNRLHFFIDHARANL
jgi:predicted nucleotide-binding protein (sugar kinase/HSP70/actin superfamily)